jgi:STE24 endopeptidase
VSGTGTFVARSSARSPGPSEDRLDRRSAWLQLAVATLVLVVLAALLVPWDWVPGGTLTPARAQDVFTAAEIRRAEDYATAMRILSWSSYAASLLLAGVLGFTRMGSSLARRLGPRLRWWLRVPLDVLVLAVAGSLLTLPFGLLIRRRNLAEGLTHQSLVGWFGDRGLSLLVSWVTTSVVVLLVVGLARRFPRRWHVPAGAVVGVLAFLGSMAYPVVVQPLFNRFTPMADGPLKHSLLTLAAREGVPVHDVLVADASRRTTTLNAYVSGIGATRRIVVYDNLLADLPPAQVKSVVAHELGHARYHDVVTGTALGAVGGVAGVALLALLLDAQWLRRRSGSGSPRDPAVTPLILALLAIGGFLVSPAENTVSRAIEARADRTALEATHDPAAFDRMQRQLALKSLADPTPPAWSQLWFGSHPTVLQRVGLAASLERADR